MASNPQVLSPVVESRQPRARFVPLESETPDLIQQARLMASGQSRLLPTLAHVRALVALVDAMADGIDARDQLMHELIWGQTPVRDRQV